MQKRIVKKKNLAIIILTLVLLSFAFIKLINSDPDYSYEDKTVFSENNNIVYPSFKDEDVQTIIDKIYSEKLSMLFGSITYELTNIKEGIVNIFFTIDNDGKKDYRSFLIDLSNKKELAIENIVKDKEKFTSVVNTNFLNKYPSFLLDLVNEGDGNTSYLIKDNEINIYYTNYVYENYQEDMFIKINNNELLGILDYSFLLDDIYENENIFSIDENKKSIALTFDDGPSAVTDKMLDVLKNNHASATFFVQGYRLKNHPDSLLRIISEGSEIGNHTYNHKQLNKLSKEEILNQINNTNNKLKSLIDSETSLVRPPYGNVNQTVLDTVNYPLILWSVDSKDWDTKDVDKIVNNVVNNACNGCIILFHDTYERSVNAIEKLLPKLYTMGYQIMSVSKLAELKGITLENNKTYRYIR